MDGSIQSAAYGFNLRYTKFTRDKFGSICVTNQGLVRIRKSDKGPSNQENSVIRDILFQHEVKEYLYANGLAVDRFLISSQNHPYFRSGDDIYTAAYVYNTEVDFSSQKTFLEVISYVAKMHNLLSNTKISAEKPKSKQKNNVCTEKILENATQNKKKLLKSGKFSEFDMFFLKGYEKLAPHIAAFGALPKDFLDNKDYICHNLLKEENIYFQDGQTILTNFSEVGMNHYLHDLAYIIKRYVKGQYADFAPLNKILEVYKASHPTADFAPQTLKRILLYPDKFIKVTTDYYSKKRSFAPKTYLSRIEDCLNTNEILTKYIN